MSRAIRGLSLAIVAAFAHSPLAANGEILIDDFVDSAMAVSPDMANEFVESKDVGDLSANRSIRVAAFPRPTVAKLDANATKPSSLTMDLTSVNVGNVLFPQVAFQFNYEFSATDLTGGGKYDAIFVDFDYLVATSAAPQFRVLLFLADAVYPGTVTSTFAGNIISDEPFTVVIPFNDLTPRGGGPAIDKLLPVTRANLEVLDFWTNDQSSWSGRISAIRIGQIPEPTSFGISAVVLLAATSRRRRYARIRR
ncbi:MAG: hypothetical protein KDA61_05960 [Planctomycetales bacterium]|nr:hypothetical protein [Planctomycetales bacterium]